MLRELSLVLAMICAAPQTGQNSDQNSDQNPGTLTIRGQATAPAAIGHPLRTTYFSAQSANRGLDAKIAEAAKKMRQAETRTERDEAESNLTDLLSQDYDQRLEGYADEIDRLEKAIEEMREKLQKRRNAKEEMIELRIQVLQAEADDLGWPVRHRATGFPALIRREGSTAWGVPVVPAAPPEPTAIRTTR